MINIALFINSNCNNCKLMQHELTDNPPNGDLYIIDVDKENSAGYPYRNRVKVFPTTVVYTYPQVYEIAWFEGFVSTKTIDEEIKKFNNMKQNIWCKFFGLHKYEILQQTNKVDAKGNVIGVIIVSRCSNCGKISYKTIYTEETNHV